MAPGSTSPPTAARTGSRTASPTRATSGRCSWIPEIRTSCWSRRGGRVYALIGAKADAGLYRSDDSGATWRLAGSDPRLTSRNWYFCRVTVDPQNPDVVYVPNVALLKSTDGGKTFGVLKGQPGGDDYHELWIDPTNPTRMIVGSDQGAVITLDGGRSWSSWYNQPTAQLYHVVTDDAFPYRVYGP